MSDIEVTPEMIEAGYEMLREHDLHIRSGSGTEEEALRTSTWRWHCQVNRVWSSAAARATMAG
jgi:hypothetical protein